MSSVTWEEYLKVITTHLGLKETDISKETDIYKDLGMDSLGVVSLGMKIQAQFKVRVPMSAVSEIYTIGDFYDILIKLSKVG